MEWTEERIDILKNCYEEGMNTDEIAKILDSTGSAIRNKAWRLNITKPNDWTQEEVDYLKENYKSFNLRKISRKLGRPKTNVCRKARQLGIERNKRKQEVLTHKAFQYKLWYPTTEDLKAATSKRVKEWIAKNGHPRGMLGKTHTEEYRKEISKRVIDYWKNITPEQMEVRRIKTIRTKIKNNTLNPNLTMSNPYSRTKSGKREDLNNQFFRSSWEANIARYFNYVGIKWEYEPKTFYFEDIKRGCVSYTPDFYLPDENRWVEVKGWMDDKSKTKLKRFAKFYPEENLELIGAKEYKEFKKWERIIPNWE